MVLYILTQEEDKVIKTLGKMTNWTLQRDMLVLRCDCYKNVTEKLQIWNYKITLFGGIYDTLNQVWQKT